MSRLSVMSVILLLVVGSWSSAQSVADTVPVPVTRRGLKAALEAQKEEENATAFPGLTTEEVRNRQGDWVVVDVRDSNAFNGWPVGAEKQGGRIAGAVNVAIPWVAKDLKGTAELLKVRGITKGKAKILLYGSTAAQATQMADLLVTKHAVDRERLHIYKDGFAAWSAAGLPTDRLPHIDRLVSPGWLDRERKARPELRIFAVSWGKGEDYEKGHIPGAFHLNTDLLETPPIWDLVPRDQLKKVLASLGVTRDTPVVLYGPNPMPSFFAAAVMRHVGVKDVRVLNGGYPAWVAARLPVEKGTNTPRASSDFGSDDQQLEVFVGIDVARKLLVEPNKLLVDVRSWKEYIGAIPGYDDITACGRIRGAVWGRGGSDAHNMEDYRNPDGTMRDYHDITRAWREAGITADKTVGFYCGTGWRASEAYMAAQLMGWQKISVYDGGWYEWSADPKNPTEVGDPSDAVPGGGTTPRPTGVYVLVGLGALLVGGLVWWMRGRRL